jgi:hypothetical protein
MRNRRDRERQACPECGKEVTVRRDGGLMAHRRPDGTTCVTPKWKQDAQAATEDA